MANPLWPASLPQTPFGNDAPTYTPVDNILRSKMQGGVDKSRPLFTATSAMITITLMLNQAQRNTLVDDFLKTTLGYVLPFDWIDFRTGAAATYRYGGTALPAETYIGQDATGTWWKVSFDLELMP